MSLPKDLTEVEADQLSKPIYEGTTKVVSIDDVVNQEVTKALVALRKKLEKEFKNKYSKAKGKDMAITIHCTACTKNYVISGKNNKTDAKAYQVCPHTIMKLWEIVH